MEILDRYIRRAVILNITLVVLVLTALFAVISFAGEFTKVGQENYTILLAVQYTLLRLPSQAYDFFPMASLLGTLLGMGALSNHSELIIIRASGVSLNRITFSVIKASFIIIIFAVLVGEFVAPQAKQYAQQLWLKALNRNVSLNTIYGLWMRDAENYIHVKRVDVDGKLLNISIYTVDENNKLKTVTTAQSATYDKTSGWLLKNIKKSFISTKIITVETLPELQLKDLLPPDVIKIVSIKPSMMSVWTLKGYIKYLDDNGLNTALYEMSIWSKIYMPLSIVAMVMLAMPIIFGAGRGSSTGKRIVIGFLLGVAFFIINRLFAQAGMANNIPAAISTIIPTICVLGTSIWVLRRFR